MTTLLQEVPIDEIEPSQKFRTINRKTAKYKRTMRSMDRKGQLEPISVRVLENGRKKVEYGDNRLDIARQLGWKTISAIITNDDETTATFKQVAENRHRNNDVNPALLGDWFRQLILQGWTPAKIAEESDELNDKYILHCIKVSEKVHPTLHTEFADVIPASVAILFSRIPIETQPQVFEKLKKRFPEDRGTVAQVQGILGPYLRATPPSPQALARQVYVCESCKGLLTKEDIDTGKAESTMRTGELGYVHTKLSDCSFTDTIVVSYPGDAQITAIREHLNYAKEKLQLIPGVTVTRYYHQRRKQSPQA